MKACKRRASIALPAGLSFDAAASGVSTTLDDAYRYAKGEAVVYLGRSVRRNTPLDFLAQWLPRHGAADCRVSGRAVADGHLAGRHQYGRAALPTRTLHHLCRLRMVADAGRRVANERLVELAQNTGTSETRPEFGAPDEFADFHSGVSATEEDNFSGALGRSDQPAIYYARVLEIPTPRWSTHLAVRKGLPLPEQVPASIQERAWTSPVFYTP